jgi:hypothetical protein
LVRDRVGEGDQEWSKNRSLTEVGEQPENGVMKKETLKRIVASGISNQLGFFVTLNPDCSSRGDIVARIVNKPQHGSAEASAITGYLRASQHKVHPNCTKNKVKGVALNYKAESKYVGDDALDVIMFYPDGWTWEVHLDLSVR